MADSTTSASGSDSISGVGSGAVAGATGTAGTIGVGTAGVIFLGWGAGFWAETAAAHDIFWGAGTELEAAAGAVGMVVTDSREGAGGSVDVGILTVIGDGVGSSAGISTGSGSDGGADLVGTGSAGVTTGATLGRNRSAQDLGPDDAGAVGAFGVDGMDDEFGEDCDNDCVGL